MCVCVHCFVVARVFWVVAFKLKSKELTAKSIGSLLSSLFYVFFLYFLLMLWWPMLCRYTTVLLKMYVIMVHFWKEVICYSVKLKDAL